MIRLIEGNAKGRHIKQLTCKGTLRQVFICVRPGTPYLPPLRNVYVYTVYIFIQGRREGGIIEPERRLEGQKFTKPVENTIMADRISSL